MKYLNLNIKKLKKVILIVLMSFCFSLSIANISSANDFNVQNNESNTIKISKHYSKNSVVAAAFKNDVCDVHKMRERYQSSCYSCIVVKTLTETFMNACSKVYPVSRDAGSKILLIGSILWLVIFALKNVSSFTSLEPSNNINDFFVFLFKVLVAAVFINAGIGILIKYIIEPILTAGADYGLGVMLDALEMEKPETQYQFKGAEIISANAINRLFAVNQQLDKTVSQNLVLGNALICHANNAGAWVDRSFGFFSIKIANLWILLCGAAIWFAGFMLTLSISYYVLDVSFKLGFAIILLPVVIGLWPFAVTSDKLGKIFSIVLKSAAIFAFLAITASYAIKLISAAMGGMDKIYDRIAKDDSVWISQTFEITGPSFILIIFAYLYSIKMIGGTINDYVDKFFSDAAFGGGMGASPIHRLGTHATDIVKQKSMGVAKGAAKLGGRAAVAGAKGMVNFAKNGESGGTTLYGNAAKLTGRFAQFTGRSTAALGRLNGKVNAKLQQFSDKQITKGSEKSNVFRLAAGGLAGKMANTKIPGSEKAIALGQKMEKMGSKVENHGKNFDTKYRGVKTQVKNAVKDEVALAKASVNQGKAYVKGIVKDAKESAKDDLKAVGGAIQKTKVYQAASSGINTAGSTISRGYNAAATRTKGAVVGATRKVEQTAQEIGQIATEAGKRTWAYKGGKYVGEKSAQFANYGSEKVGQGVSAVKGAAQDLSSTVMESSVVQGTKRVVAGTGELARKLDQGVTDGYKSLRSNVGGVVGDVKEAAVEGIKGEIKAVKGAVKEKVNDVVDFKNEVGRSINKGLYNKVGGDNLASRFAGDSEERAKRMAQYAADKQNKESQKEKRNASSFIYSNMVKGMNGSNDGERTEVRNETTSQSHTQSRQNFNNRQQKVNLNNFENRMSVEERVKQEAEKIKIDYKKITQGTYDKISTYNELSARNIQEAQKYDALAKNAASDEERNRLNSMAEESKEKAKTALTLAAKERRKNELTHLKEAREKNKETYVKIAAGNAFRDSLPDKDKELYDKNYIATERAMKDEWNDKQIRKNLEDDFRNIRNAERFGIRDAVVEGKGYSFATDTYGNLSMSDTPNGYNFVRADALNAEDRKLYNEIAARQKTESGETYNKNDTDKEFLETKHDEIYRKMEQTNRDELNEERRAGAEARGNLDSAKELETDEQKHEKELMERDNNERIRKDEQRKKEIEKAEKELEDEINAQKEVEVQKIRDRIEKEEAERLKNELEQKAQEQSQTVERETPEEQAKTVEKAQEQSQTVEREDDKERREKEERERQERDKKEEERQKKEKREKEEREKREKEKKEKEQRRKEDEEKRKKEEQQLNQEREDRNRFENEYRDLLRKYNVTDASSVEGLTDSQRSALKEGIETLRNKYKI